MPDDAPLTHATWPCEFGSHRRARHPQMRFHFFDEARPVEHLRIEHAARLRRCDRSTIPWHAARRCRGTVRSSTRCCAARAGRFEVAEPARLDHRLDREAIERRPGDATLFDAGVKRVLVHDPATGAVDEVRVRLHERQLARADQAAGLVGQRAVDRDEIAAAQQLVQPRGARPSLAASSAS
jgi:hypothetical protein